MYGKPQILHVLNRKEVQKEDSNFCRVLFSCSMFLFATGALCCRTFLMGSHPQSGCVGSGGTAALCCGSFLEDGAGRVAVGLCCDSVRWGLSPCLSVGTRAGAAACSRSLPVHTEAASQSLAHDGSIGQPLEQGSEEKAGLGVSC